MKVLYISASNMLRVKPEESVSYTICRLCMEHAQERFPDAEHTIIELKHKTLLPCVGCGQCYSTHRCALGDDFNAIYEQALLSDLIVFVSPHYAPIPAKLAALLERMEQITFLHWGADSTYRSGLYGVPAGVISHGGGSDWALQSYKRMVNDTIANALDTIQLKLVPFSEEWNTGISLPLQSAVFAQDAIFPTQIHDWNRLTPMLHAYMDLLLNAAAAR